MESNLAFYSVSCPAADTAWNITTWSQKEPAMNLLLYTWIFFIIIIYRFQEVNISELGDHIWLKSGKTKENFPWVISVESFSF